MMVRTSRRTLVLCALLTLVVAGCSDDSPTAIRIQPGETAVSDFSVRDVNPGSSRFDEMVSPRDYLGQVSAWYFGHAT